MSKFCIIWGLIVFLSILQDTPRTVAFFSNSESSLCDQRVAENPRFVHAYNEDSDQTGHMSRLIRVFAGLVLSCRGSYIVLAL